jgi:hypothetical protein
MSFSRFARYVAEAARATPAERVAAAREIGVATVWDDMVTRLLETEEC